MKKSQLISLIFILLTVILIVYILTKNNHHSDTEVVKCISSKSTLYVTTGCTACQYQEKLFGDNFKYLNVVNCAITPEKCQDIEWTPTWLINGNKLIGAQSIEKLKEETNC